VLKNSSMPPWSPDQGLKDPLSAVFWPWFGGVGFVFDLPTGQMATFSTRWGLLRSSIASFASWDIFTKVVKKVLTWQRPCARSPPGLREEAELDRLGEDLVPVVSETLQPELVRFLLRPAQDPQPEPQRCHPLIHLVV
jgi:hypothetical protein